MMGTAGAAKLNVYRWLSKLFQHMVAKFKRMGAHDQ